VQLQPPGDPTPPFQGRISDRSEHPVLTLLDTRADLGGLPVRRGDDCRLAPAAARQLGQWSRRLRLAFAELEKAGFADADDLKRILGPFDPEAAAPLMLQMLQCEDEPMRALLIEQMRRAKGPASSKVLAHRAVFELIPELRQEAVKALAERPPAEVRPPLLAGFRHPWPPAAEHAATALVALNDRGAVPGLVQLLDGPDPAAPSRGADGRPVVREMVRINHARNCLLCHAPSYSGSDPVRVAVPSPDQPLPPPFSVKYYDAGDSGAVVRADVTYLRQDFSLTLPVENPGRWPGRQRYDFFVRTRPATPDDPPAAPGTDSPQRRLVLKTLRTLTGQNFVTAAGWHSYLRTANVPGY
jgi:hypothetical protein